jgi:uncharacterized protein (DUF2252 family)
VTAMPPSLEERRARGQQARESMPLSSQAGWEPAPGRADPIDLLEEQNRTRAQDLVPVRHGRMMASPFTFYRGTANIMAGDFAGSPTAGLEAQLCGDAHLSNFGIYASPERRLLFDLNDFDETLPGPFEYDVKRLAASFTVAARNNGFSAADAKAVTIACVASYREAMADFAQMSTMDVWYARLDEDRVLAIVHEAVADTRKRAEAAKGKTKAARKKAKKEARAAEAAEKAMERGRAQARARNSLQALSKLGEVVDGTYRIANHPPVLVPMREWVTSYGFSPDRIAAVIREQFRAYRLSLGPDRRQLIDRFRVVDVARKVVGVGSVGTQAFIVLLEGRDANDPLFLQIKQATESVLEAHLAHSRYRQHGQRVVQGQRLMQAASDIYLGWSQGGAPNPQFYWRQLRDMKASISVEDLSPRDLTSYARVCGWTLARAHARSGDPVALAAYLGEDNTFDRSIAKFARRYADQTERDYEAFLAAIRSGHLQAQEGV